MGNLLTLKETFKWEDTEIDRSESIKNLNAAILKSKGYDELFKTSDFNSITTSWGNLMEFIFSYGFDDETRQKTFPWMSQQIHITLVYILSSFKNTSEFNSDDLNSFKKKFPQENCEHIGFKGAEISQYVSCETSWYLFHSNYVKDFDRHKRQQNKTYFIKFHKPELRESSNQIERLIKRRQLPSFIKRVDEPSFDPNGKLLHGEQIQVHFNDKDKSALNIDGTWKHTSCTIPDIVCEKLIEWGFILPENRL